MPPEGGVVGGVTGCGVGVEGGVVGGVTDWVW